MTSSGSRARAWLLVGALLLVAAGWFLLRRAPDDHEERADAGRADVRDQAPLPLIEDVAVELRPSPAPPPPSLPPDYRDASSELVGVRVTVVADEGAKGEALVEAGPTEATRKPRGYVAFGQTVEMQVPARTRSWRAVARGSDAICYEGPVVPHDPARGDLVLPLRRGPVSLHIRVLDVQGRTVPDVQLHLSGLPGLDWAVSRKRSDERGEVRWEGLSARFSHDDLRVESLDAPQGMRVRERATVRWDQARQHGEGVVTLDWIRTHLEVVVSDWTGGWILERQTEDGAWRPHCTDRLSGLPKGSSRAGLPEQGTHPVALHATTTDLVPGHYRITLGLANGELGQAEFTLAHGDSLRVATFERLRPRTFPARLAGPGVGRVREVRIVPAGQRQQRPPTGFRHSPEPALWLDLPVGADGSFELPALDGFEDVWVLPVPDVANDMSVVPRRLVLRSEAPLEVESVAMVRASGRVVDSRGRPIARATVSVLIRPALPAAREPSHPAWFEHPLPTSVSTDADGRFTTEQGVPGAWVFFVSPLGRGTPGESGTQILVGPGTSEIELTG